MNLFETKDENATSALAKAKNASLNTFPMWPPVSWLFIKFVGPDKASEMLKTWVKYHTLSQSSPRIGELVVHVTTQTNNHAFCILTSNLSVGRGF